MTTILVRGFESGTTEEWTNTQVDAVNKYTGGYGLGMGPNGSTLLLPSAQDVLYLGFFQNMTDDAIAWTTVAHSLRNGGDEAVGIGFDFLGRPYITVLGVQQPGFGPALGRDTWHLIELYAKIAAGGPGGGEATLRIDGDIVIEIEEIDTRPGGATTVDRLYTNYNANGFGLVLDDLTINDNSGSIQNSFPNGIRWLRVDVDGDGNYSQWDALGGGDHYAKVDEIPPSGADYVYTATAAERDSYTLENTGSAGLPVGATIVATQQIAYVSEDVASANTVDTFIRLAGANDDDGIGHSLPLTMGRREGQIRHEKPGGGAWGASDIDALEIGILS